ncbi:MAG: hypothetical protein IKO89_06790 [Bacteroidales bacterium]|nr:hypothetical protein [Bacteroidales bacterium]
MPPAIHYSLSTIHCPAARHRHSGSAGTSALSIWLSVDPMADKYPSLSPYAYCGNNPVKLVDKDGRKVKPYDRQSKQYITMYFKQLFGTAKMFRYKDGFLTINERKFNKYYSTATADQQELLNGFKKAIERDEIALIQIQNNPKSYVFYTYKNVYDGDYFMGQDKDRYSSPFRKTGVPAATFVHELLDEFLNFYCLKETNTETPQSEKVKFHNTALRILQCIERSGNDHE